MPEGPTFHSSQAPGRLPLCSVCGKSSAEGKLPFAVGREDTPPLPQKRRLLGFIPWKKTFVQRHKWVWQFLWVCRDCRNGHHPETIWRAIQDHPGTRRLVAQGYTETRVDPSFRGGEEETTFTEEPV